MNYHGLSLLMPVALLLVLLSTVSATGNAHDYEISEYCAIFDLDSWSTDVKVTLEIVYPIGETSKSEGFKYVGANTVFELSCHDEAGEDLSTRVTGTSWKKIEWQFSPVRKGSKKITVQFKSKGLLSRIRGTNVLDVSWAGFFQVPVHKSRFVIILPVDADHKTLTMRPGIWTKRTTNGRLVLERTQEPLIGKDIVVQYGETKSGSSMLIWATTFIIGFAFLIWGIHWLTKTYSVGKGNYYCNGQGPSSHDGGGGSHDSNSGGGCGG